MKDPTFFGLDVGARSAREQNENPSFVIFGAIVLALCAIAVANMRRSGVGRRFLAVRANERAAAAAGINVTRTKLLAFGISAALAGIGGVMLGFKQVEVSSANFNYGASLSVLAFAYLGRHLVDQRCDRRRDAAVRHSCRPRRTTSSPARTSTATSACSAASASSSRRSCIRKESHRSSATAFRHLGNWLVGAIPGAETLRSNYRGPKQVLVKSGLAVLVVGTAFWLYNAKFVESVEWWVFISLVLLYIVVLAFAKVVGPIAPTFGDAGRQWASAGRRFGPTALVGYVLGWIIWPLRVDTYSAFWMPILGALLALMVRSIYRQIRGARRWSRDRSTNRPHEHRRQHPDTPQR